MQASMGLSSSSEHASSDGPSAPADTGCHCCWVVRGWVVRGRARLGCVIVRAGYSRVCAREASSGRQQTVSSSTCRLPTFVPSASNDVTRLDARDDVTRHRAHVTIFSAPSPPVRSHAFATVGLVCERGWLRASHRPVHFRQWRLPFFRKLEKPNRKLLLHKPCLQFSNFLHAGRRRSVDGIVETSRQSASPDARAAGFLSGVLTFFDR